ncbi:hypoxanthine phosphoribosyltransferase [Desulfobacter curvatus]|uniref:hypoxanthine phosphoribosyltransferase n=1 Tax=Desulfobacter curvatus TaxID=2290 RepID=UPI00037C0950|nr:hypoxanthine phosphoribosyltransferase [Desulfobacter curvatus]
MPELIPLISQQEIEEKIQETGQKITQDYKGLDLVVIGVLKGAFVFLADLVRQITIDLEIDLVGASSYQNTSSTGQIVFTKQPDLELKGRDILLVEDIVDTGRTITKTVESMQLLNPRSIKICALIDKKERRETQINVDYSCFCLDGFIVGYGLDYNEKYRNLPAIFELKF